MKSVYLYIFIIRVSVVRNNNHIMIPQIKLIVENLLSSIGKCEKLFIIYFAMVVALVIPTWRFLRKPQKNAPSHVFCEITFI
jgi:hypothetical protein